MTRRGAPRETLGPQGRVEAALGYYPALVNLPRIDPETFEWMQGEISTPTLAIFGDADPARELSEDEDVNFSALYRFELVEGAGPFVHCERLDEINRLGARLAARGIKRLSPQVRERAGAPRASRKESSNDL